MVCYHSGGVSKGEKLTAHQYMVVGNNFDTVEGLYTEQAVNIRADHLWLILSIRAKRYGSEVTA